MADARINALTAATAMASTDVTVIVSDPAGTPTTKQITRTNLFGGTSVTQVVGTTETQTLTNKTLTSPKINEAVAITATATELNYTDGVTSAIQTQLDLKAALLSPSFTTPALGVATATSINKVTITAPAASATLTIANTGSLITSGAYAITLTATGTTGITLPTTGTLATLAGTETFTNKRRTRRSSVVTQSATPTINTDNMDIALITGLAQAITSFTTNLSGTPIVGDMLEIQITDNGTARGLTFGASFASTGNVILPTTTVLGVKLRVLFEWGGSTWDCVGIA